MAELNITKDFDMQNRFFRNVLPMTALAAAAALGVPPNLASAATVDVQQSPFRTHSIQTTARVEAGRRVEFTVQNLTVSAPRVSVGAKVRFIDESASRPSFAIGVTDVARYSAKTPSPNEGFATLGKHIGGIDVAAGMYNLSHSFVKQYAGAKASGMLIHIRGNITEGLSASFDAATNRTPVGMTSIGLGYRVSRSVRFMPSYVFFNDRRFGHNGLRLGLQYISH